MGHGSAFQKNGQGTSSPTCAATGAGDKRRGQPLRSGLQGRPLRNGACRDDGRQVNPFRPRIQGHPLGGMPGNLIARHAGSERQARQAGRGHGTIRAGRRIGQENRASMMARLSAWNKRQVQRLERQARAVKGAGQMARSGPLTLAAGGDGVADEGRRA